MVLVVKNLPTSAGDAGLISGLGRSPEGGHDNPLQYSCLENPMDRGARWAMVLRVTKSQIQMKRLSMQACRYPRFILCLIVHVLCLIHDPGVLEIFYFFLFYVYTDSSSEDERLTPSFSLLKELSEKWTPLFYLPGSNENCSESKENVFRKCTHSTFGI